MIKDIIYFFKYQKIIKDVFKNESFIDAISTSFGVQFHTDKIHRLYAVINPHIQNMGETGNNIIYDGNDTPMVDKWVLGNLTIIDMAIKNHQLFDILTYKINQIDDDLNFSLVIQNALLDLFFKHIKRIGICMGILITVAIILLILL